MMRRIPSMCVPFVIAFVLAFIATSTTPCFAGDETEDGPGLIVNRCDLDVDDIKPGDDDQPTISGRRRAQTSTQSALPNPGALPEAGISREGASESPAPIGVIRTWIENLRVLVERIDILR
jgi:hypothetical protein